MDLDEAYKKMEKCPQTYATIIGEMFGSETQKRIVRRKLNREFTRGNVSKLFVPGSMYSRVIFYPHDKIYTIFVVQRLFGDDVYYCDGFTEKGSRIIVPKLYVLKGTNWICVGEKTLQKEDIVKVI